LLELGLELVGLVGICGGSRRGGEGGVGREERRSFVGGILAGRDERRLGRGTIMRGETGAVALGSADSVVMLIDGPIELHVVGQQREGRIVELRRGAMARPGQLGVGEREDRRSR